MQQLSDVVDVLVANPLHSGVRVDVPHESEQVSVVDVAVAIEIVDLKRELPCYLCTVLVWSLNLVEKLLVESSVVQRVVEVKIGEHLVSNFGGVDCLQVVLDACLLELVIFY
jgi:hypothetical protein